MDRRKAAERAEKVPTNFMINKISLLFCLMLLPFVVTLDCGNGSASASIKNAVAGVVAAENMNSALPERMVAMAPPAYPKPLILKRQVHSSVLTFKHPDTLPYLTFAPAMLEAMYEQANYLRRSDAKKYPVKGISKAEMLKTVELLQECQILQPEAMLDRFDFYQVNTELKKDRVRITGYYTPIVQASRVQTPEFSIPILRRPEHVPSPAAIAAGALDGKGLEMAWVRSKKELANAQLQGSCWVEYADGKREHFGFGGSVKGAGGVYVFFTKVDEKVLGAGFFPLTAGYSVAVDPRVIPIGATLLAELPDMDPAGNLKGYTYRILFAQDRGGAILTTKRLDLYSGIGMNGLQEARKINGHGRLWVLLPKQ